MRNERKAIKLNELERQKYIRVHQRLTRAIDIQSLLKRMRFARRAAVSFSIPIRLFPCILNDLMGCQSLAGSCFVFIMHTHFVLMTSSRLDVHPYKLSLQ